MFGHLAVYNEDSNTVYLFGGVAENYDVNYNRIYKWDLTQQDSWFVQIGTTPTSEFFSFGNNAVLIDDIIYFIGVEDTSKTSGNIYLFNTTSDSWIDGSSLSSPREPMVHGCLTTNGTHIYMVDGWIGGNAAKNPFFQIYDISNDSWTTYSFTEWTVNGGWRMQYCSLVDNQLFIMGGKIGSGSYDTYIDKYDTIQGSYTAGIEQLSDEQSWGVAVYHNGLVYLVGSYPYTTNINTFDVKTENLSSTTFTMTQNIAAAGAVVINDTLWIFGGEDDNIDAVSHVEICDLPS